MKRRYSGPRHQAKRPSSPWQSATIIINLIIALINLTLLIASLLGN